MKCIRRVIPVLLVIGVAASSGCVYWRLFKFKQQLKDFNEHFEFRSNGAYSLVIKEPLVTGGDFDKLMDVEPTRREEEPDGTWRVYEFEKQPPDGSEALIYRFGFDSDKLTLIVFPDQFTKLYPADALAEFLRSLGEAEVEKKERSAHSRAYRRHLLEQLPDSTRVLDVLGEPTERERDRQEGWEDLLYRYRLRTQTVGEKEAKRRALGRFRYADDGRLLQVEAAIGKHRLSFDIPEPEVTDEADSGESH
jgi:hypothetical protein